MFRLFSRKTELCLSVPAQHIFDRSFALKQFKPRALPFKPARDNATGLENAPHFIKIRFSLEGAKAFSFHVKRKFVQIMAEREGFEPSVPV